jgi:DNA-directed RNA polymerase subunit RPC12/RpoP
VKIVEQIWKGMLVDCRCGETIFVEAYAPEVRCANCGRKGALLKLLASWYGVDKLRIEANVAKVAA